jgi:hypothetical protein
MILVLAEKPSVGSKDIGIFGYIHSVIGALSYYIIIKIEFKEQK